METTNERIKNLLIEHKIRPSNYRIRVLQCLEDKKLHPTADEMFQNLTKEYPTLSKMSVYNTIDILQKSGLIRSITIENNEVRYDALLDEHGHFKCTMCGKISNFDLDLMQVKITGLDHYQIEEKDVFFKGVCPDCLKNRNSQ